MISLNGARSGPAISTMPFRGAARATSATIGATSSAAMTEGHEKQGDDRARESDSRAIGELSRPLGKDVLAEAMMKSPGPVAVTPGGSARGTSEGCRRASRKNRNRIQEEHLSEAILISRVVELPGLELDELGRQAHRRHGVVPGRRPSSV